MKKTLGISLLFILTTLSLSAKTGTVLENHKWKININNDGTVESMSVNRKEVWDKIEFMQDTCQGVSWFTQTGEERFTIPLSRTGNNIFKGQLNNIEYRIRYEFINDNPAVTASIKNNNDYDFEPEKAGVTFGLSNYMTSYPQWDNIYFPTLLRCEKTHFWGYMMTPRGDILGIASEDPIASWSLNYNFGYNADKEGNFFWGHRVYSFNLDFINRLPLPERHPQNLSKLPAKGQMSWTIQLTDIDGIDNIIPSIAESINAPVFEIKRTSVEEGEPVNLKIHGDIKASVNIKTPNGESITLKKSKSGEYSFMPRNGAGVYTITAENAKGKRSEAMISVLKPWSWYLEKARDGSLKYTQKASWNCENWYGFFSAYLAEKHFPNPEKLNRTNQRFDKIMPLMFDTVNYAPTQLPTRIQNSAITIGIYVDKYQALGNIRDLEMASGLADWIINNAQSEDGAYRSHKIHYTSVIYIAKSIMELYTVEKELGRTNPEWQQRYERHYASVKRSIDQLMLGPSAIDTEGQLTFEDGMISCTALQIAAFALQQEDRAERERYMKTAMEFLEGHSCLTQQIVPDSRQRGGTLRFWEAQYDVLLGHNMLSSPHAWTSWRTYGTYYMYLLTGEEKWLTQTMNALGTCMQVIDYKTGDLRWAFVVDPYVSTNQIAENFPGTDPDTYNANQFKSEQGKTKPVIIGEQYVNMIADWFYANSSDNDVHEHFKCMEELILTSAYVIEREDGSIKGYNCEVSKTKNGITITPREDIVQKVHLNLNKPASATINWNGITQTTDADNTMQWIYKTTAM